MNVGGDFTVWCFECDCISLLLALIFGILICVSVGIIVRFFKWRIERELEFDRTIFENFGRMTCQVGGTRNNNAQNNGTTPDNGNVQNAGAPNGQ